MKDETLTKVLTLVSKANSTEVQAIQQALSLRMKTIRYEESIKNRATLKIGDVVRLKGLKPAYLNRSLGTITDTHPKGFIVELSGASNPRAIARFGNKPIVPANCLEKI